ncbi:family 10 glycosylhydrolase [Anthocerotibacter panamensis]|uniref:family 10 glycosylhydrolase n=1 Tax=Anthocerotibacter panamensis TaxID=2857077 RepID=UPI0028F3FA62|nr:family 10 glycosylhydrolase [Anthocerotibacter panamensis]
MPEPKGNKEKQTNFSSYWIHDSGKKPALERPGEPEKTFKAVLTQPGVESVRIVGLSTGRATVADSNFPDKVEDQKKRERDFFREFNKINQQAVKDGVIPKPLKVIAWMESWAKTHPNHNLAKGARGQTYKGLNGQIIKESEPPQNDERSSGEKPSEETFPPSIPKSLNAQLDAKGNGGLVFLDPFNDYVHQQLKAATLDIASRPEVSAVELDDNFAVTDTTKEEILKRHPEAQTYKGGPEQWLQDKLTAQLRDLSNAIHQKKKQLLIAVNPLKHALENNRQDVAKWVKEGLVDGVTVQIYRKNADEFEKELQVLINQINDEKKNDLEKLRSGKIPLSIGFTLDKAGGSIIDSTTTNDQLKRLQELIKKLPGQKNVSVVGWGLQERLNREPQQPKKQAQLPQEFDPDEFAPQLRELHTDLPMTEALPAPPATPVTVQRAQADNAPVASTVNPFAQQETATDFTGANSPPEPTLAEPAETQSAKAPLSVQDAQSPSAEALYPQFLLPLGTQSLGVIRPLTLSMKEMDDYSPPDYSFEHLPFFAESRAALQAQPSSYVAPNTDAPPALSLDRTAPEAEDLSVSPTQLLSEPDALPITEPALEDITNTAAFPPSQEIGPAAEPVLPAVAEVPALQAFTQRTQEPYDNLPVTWTTPTSTPEPALADLADTSAPTAPSIQDIPPAEATPIRQGEVPALQTKAMAEPVNTPLPIPPAHITPQSAPSVAPTPAVLQARAETLPTALPARAVSLDSPEAIAIADDAIPSAGSHPDTSSIAAQSPTALPTLQALAAPESELPSLSAAPLAPVNEPQSLSDVHISRKSEPVSSIEEPSSLSAAPLAPVNEPQSLSDVHISRKSEPVSSIEEPSSLSDLPVSSINEPQSLSDVHISRKSEPVSSIEEPSSLSDLPVSSINEPSSLSDVPVSSIEEPRSLNDLPVSSIEEPRSLNDLPVSSIEEPQSLSDLPVSSIEEPSSLSDLPVSSINESPLQTLTSPASPTLQAAPSESPAVTTPEPQALQAFATPLTTETALPTVPAAEVSVLMQPLESPPPVLQAAPVVESPAPPAIADSPASPAIADNLTPAPTLQTKAVGGAVNSSLSDTPLLQTKAATPDATPSATSSPPALSTPPTAIPTGEPAPAIEPTIISLPSREVSLAETTVQQPEVPTLQATAEIPSPTLQAAAETPTVGATLQAALGAEISTEGSAESSTPTLQAAALEAGVQPDAATPSPTLAPTLQATAETPTLQAAPGVEAPIEGSTPPTLQAKATVPVDPMVEPVVEPPLQTLTSPASPTLQAAPSESPAVTTPDLPTNPAAPSLQTKREAPTAKASVPAQPVDVSPSQVPTPQAKAVDAPVILDSAIPAVPSNISTPPTLQADSQDIAESVSDLPATTAITPTIAPTLQAAPTELTSTDIAEPTLQVPSLQTKTEVPASAEPAPVPEVPASTPPTLQTPTLPAKAEVAPSTVELPSTPAETGLATPPTLQAAPAIEAEAPVISAQPISAQETPALPTLTRVEAPLPETEATAAVPPTISAPTLAPTLQATAETPTLQAAPGVEAPIEGSTPPTLQAKAAVPIEIQVPTRSDRSDAPPPALQAAPASSTVQTDLITPLKTTDPLTAPVDVPATEATVEVSPTVSAHASVSDDTPTDILTPAPASIQPLRETALSLPEPNASSNTELQPPTAAPSVQTHSLPSASTPALDSPTLPTVLENLSTLRPLVQRSSLQPEPETNPDPTLTFPEPSRPTAAVVATSTYQGFTPLTYAISPSVQRSSRQETPPSEPPDSWSSIEQLMDGHPPSAPIQRFQDTTQPPVIQRFDETPVASSAPTTTPATNTFEPHDEKEDLEQLETLAREIYNTVRQRLELERERRGNSYSGRLPW